MTTRILAIDDNDGVLNDYRKVIGMSSGVAEVDDLESALFGSVDSGPTLPGFELDTFSQGQEGYQAFVAAQRSGRPYSLVFVDMRMPPGWDGLQTMKALWDADPNAFIVLCTAYSDYSHGALVKEIGARPNFFILKKPFEPEEVLQMAISASALRARDRSEGRHCKMAFMDGLSAGEFGLMFQPIVNLGDESLRGFEALLRWTRDGQPVAPPTVFIPAAEDCGAIVEVGDFVIREAARAAARLGADPSAGPMITLNASTLQFDRSDVVATLTEACTRLGVPPARLGVELTESRLTDNAEGLLAQMVRLQEAGYPVLIDDFGTGYSGLQALMMLPFDILKLDRSFCSGIIEDAGARTLVDSVIRLAGEMGKELIVEGVETREQYDYLRARACPAVQGYFVAKPMTLEQAVRFREEWQASLEQAA